MYSGVAKDHALLDLLSMIIKGDFIRLNDPALATYGIGKIEDISDGTVTVSFFDSPVSPLYEVQTAEKYVERATLPSQTRAYWFDIGKNVWRVGRVINHEHREVDVRFPNRDDSFLKESDVFVRWDKPLADPTPYLAHQINETPIFSDGRSTFVKALINQRRASLGMPALLSSVIELEVHQIEVVRRILQDPIQRYLLADEVGLGKTIEAGVLIRQFVLDNPTNHNTIVIVPPPLVSQWLDELRRRFLLGAEIGKSLHVIPSNNLDEIRSFLKKAQMVVVDEAHHISRDRKLFEVLARETKALSRLLLLSATPVLGNEGGFLEMLHLLDPLVFRLDDVENFREKIINRQILAEAVAGLIPENMLQLPGYIDELKEKFPDDEELEHLCEKVSKVVDTFPDEQDPEFLDPLSELRAHVSETYRLDRRILRNRRKGVPGLTPDRSGVTFVDYDPPSMSKFCEALEEWRRIFTLENHNADTSEDDLICLFFQALEGLSSRQSPDKIVAYLIGARSKVAKSEESKILTKLKKLAQFIGDEADSSNAVLEYIKNSSPTTKFIIFCSDTNTSDQLQCYLTPKLSILVDRYSEVSVLDSSSPSSVFSQFQNDQNGRVLICDHLAEEGLNLQGGEKKIIHYDLPYSPNRIEQRIGRVDRYGSGASVESVAIRCVSNPFEREWSECLDTGFNVFSRSIASLQYLIDKEIVTLQSNLFREGIDSIIDLSDRLGGPEGEISKELVRIDNQDELDALIVPSEEVYDDLFDEDDKWREFRKAIDRWLSDILQMKKVDGPDVGKLIPGDEINRYMLSLGGSHQTLVPLDRFLNQFTSVLDISAPGSSHFRPLSFPYTSRRQTSLMRQSREHEIRLLRFGDQLLTGLWEITQLDDRGRSVAMWRQNSEYKSESVADLYFRFEFLIQADVESAASCYAKNSGLDQNSTQIALQRRGDMFLPPTFSQIWIDREFNILKDPVILQILNEPYLPRSEKDGRKDLNLNWDRWDTLKKIGFDALDYWNDIVTEARIRAESIIQSDEDLKSQIEKSILSAQEIDKSRFAQLQTRIRHAEGEEASREEDLLVIERETADALYDGYRKPKIILDTIGATFLSKQSLDYLALKQ